MAVVKVTRNRLEDDFGNFFPARTVREADCRMKQVLYITVRNFKGVQFGGFQGFCV